MLRNIFVIFSITVILIMVLFILVPATPLIDSPFFIELRYWRGYPWVPTLIFAVGLVSISAVAGQSEILEEWADDDALPGFVRLILRILVVADPHPLPRWAWRLSVIGSIAILGFIWQFPRCITPNDILITFSIEKGNDDIAVPSPGEIAVVMPGVKYQLIGKAEPVVDEIVLPRFKCIWATGIFQDDNLKPTTGCLVEYTSGKDSINDPISLQLFQRGCSSLGSYSFFVQREQ